MTQATRRHFLHSSGILLAAACLPSEAFGYKKKKPFLSFSTLGCPDWNFQKIVDFAVAHQYQGLEIRGLLRQMDLPKCKEFISPENRKDTVQLIRDKGLDFVTLGSSSTLHFAEGVERQKNLDEGKRFIDLAQDINCSYVRVFPNNFPKGQEKSMTIDLITKGLLELAEHAVGSGVSVLMETHGDLVQTNDLLTIMQGAQHKHCGLVWDVSNMWTVTKESPVTVYKQLKKYIRHTHIKDAKLTGGNLQYTLLGQGEVPISIAIKELIQNDYRGFYSFEWEKLWHPEIAEPEIALANFPIAFQKMIQSR